MAGDFTIRPARPADAGFLLTLRNEPEVVAASRSDRLVDTSTHAAWLSASLNSPTRRLVVLCLDNKPVGQARLDASTDGEWVSVSLTPGDRGGGHGTAALQALQAMADGDLLAEVRQTNDRSLALFHRSGFRGSAVIDGFVQLRWTKPAAVDSDQGIVPVWENSHAD